MAETRIKHPIYKGRLVDGTCALLGLVGYEITAEDAVLLPKDQLRRLEVWAERTHLRASDNPVRVPPRPEWLPQPWQGEADEWGRGPTVLDRAAIASATGATDA